MREDAATPPEQMHVSSSGQPPARGEEGQQPAAEARLRRNELRLRLALESAYMISFEWDIRRNEIHRSVSSSSVLPQTPEGRPDTFEDVCQAVHPDDRERFIANVNAALARQDGLYENEFRILQPDGSTVWLHESGRVEFDEAGKPAHLIGLAQDITRQKQTECALQESQRRYAGIVESAMDAIITIDASQRIVFFNAAAEKMFGCTAADVIGDSVDRFIPERFQHGHREHIAMFGRTGTANRKMGNLGIVVGRRTNGEEFPVEASISQASINGEKSFTAILRDISERKRTEDRLKESEALLRLFIEHAPASIAMFDQAMCYLAVSNRWKQDFRLPLDKPLLGRSHYEVFPDIPERWKAVHRRGLNGETLRKDEDSFIRQDGSTQWVKWEIIPWKRSNGQVGGILVATEEITEWMRSKEALRESREDLQRAQAVGQIGSWRLDVRNNVLTWSDENYRIFGVREGTALTYESFLNAIHPDDREYVDRQWQAGMHGEPYDIEHRIVAHGEVKWVREKAYLELDDNGVLLGGFGITQDITKRKLAELALLEANHRKDEFLAMLAHELRNPLAPISNAVQILRITQQGNPAVEQTTNMVGRQVRHLVRLVDDLLDVSRVTRGKIKLQKERVNLAEIIRQAIETSRPLIDARNHQLKVCLPQAEICVDGDATRLAQIISNLLNNAAKYTDAGGYISLMLEQRSGSIGGKALIRVKDNGRGMEPAALENLFDMFYQVDRNIDRAEGGLGIGLYLVKTLAAMHGGHVEAFSEGRGKGSEFVIHLPCLRPEQSGEGLAADAEAKPVCGKRILLVDDNPDVADSMAMLLKLFGHEIIIAYDGREAVSIALREQPDVVLLDIGLPYLNGYEACRAMRKAGLTRAMIVALTGYGQEEDRKKAQEAGFNQHLAKPVDVDVLEELLTAW